MKQNLVGQITDNTTTNLMFSLCFAIDSQIYITKQNQDNVDVKNKCIFSELCMTLLFVFHTAQGNKRN